jgi:hypothetical protein
VLGKRLVGRVRGVVALPGGGTVLELELEARGEEGDRNIGWEMVENGLAQLELATG